MQEEIINYLTIIEYFQILPASLTIRLTKYRTTNNYYYVKDLKAPTITLVEHAGTLGN